MAIVQQQLFEGKVCAACKAWKPLTSFHRMKTSPDGLRYNCKECQTALNRGYSAQPHAKRAKRAYKVAHREEHREYTKQYRSRHPEQKRQETLLYIADNPQKRKAHHAVNNAIRDGRLIRQPCEICGAKAQAHHDDYSKPLDVRWLCPVHHSEQHQACCGVEALVSTRE